MQVVWLCWPFLTNSSVNPGNKFIFIIYTFFLYRVCVVLAKTGNKTVLELSVIFAILYLDTSLMSYLPVHSEYSFTNNGKL